MNGYVVGSGNYTEEGPGLAGSGHVAGVTEVGSVALLVGTTDVLRDSSEFDPSEHPAEAASSAVAAATHMPGRTRSPRCFMRTCPPRRLIGSACHPNPGHPA